LVIGHAKVERSMLDDAGALRYSCEVEVIAKQALEPRRFLKGVDACTVEGGWLKRLT
jgi:hypothetical protein